MKSSVRGVAGTSLLQRAISVVGPTDFVDQNMRVRDSNDRIVADNLEVASIQEAMKGFLAMTTTGIKSEMWLRRWWRLLRQLKSVITLLNA